MSAPDTVIINTLEQILSSDLNRIGGLAGKATQDLAARLEAGPLGSTPRAVVRKGLDATVGAALSVDISPGEMMVFDAGTSGPDVSQYLLGRLDTIQNVALVAADPVNPRIDVIHATPVVASSDSQTRNILSLPSRVVTPTVVFKSARPSLTVAATPGIAGPTPAFPNPPAGAVPLWYVWVSANTAFILDQSLADARIRASTWPNSRRHERVDGFWAHPRIALSPTDITIRQGRAFLNGSLIANSAILVLDRLRIGPTAATPLFPANTEFSVYLVGKGNGDPVIRETEFIPVIVDSNPPLQDGRPTNPLTYRPWWRSDGTGFPGTRTTTEALHIGTFWSDNTGIWQNGGNGLALSPDARVTLPVSAIGDSTSPAHLVGGLVTKGNGWLGRPELRYVSATEVEITRCTPILGGTPINFLGVTADITADLHAAELEQASTWYYVYLRSRLPLTGILRGAYRDLVPVISASPPDGFGLSRITTPEAGFVGADYIYVGSFFNDAASNILRFNKAGGVYMFEVTQILYSLADIAVSPAFTNIDARVPQTAVFAVVGVYITAVVSPGSDFEQQFISAHDFNSSAFHFSQTYQIDDEVIDDNYGDLFVPITRANGRFRIQRFDAGFTGTWSTEIQQRGYVETEDGQQNPV